ncbi:unnamed protein product [Periconia digitata]|uniref:Uncharacterized protein n=1 Tax=Periconia digitata TaxID=1303443 RepID=A0A9W4U9G1_9PLEO|nr:unnamed protein product [Periconia digitata]
MRSIARLMRSTRRGLTSSSALMSGWSLVFVDMILDRFSISARARTNPSSMGPSAILRTMTGAMLMSSTAGPSIRSTTLRFSNLVLSAMERFWRDSISADTAPRSAWKLVRSSNLSFSLSTAITISKDAKVGKKTRTFFD